MDPTMTIMLSIAYALAGGIARTLPASMNTPAACAALVQAIDGPTVLDFTSAANLGVTIAARLQEIAKASAAHMNDVADEMPRLVIALRIWAGCLDAAKVLRDADALGNPITATMLADAFNNLIDPRAAQDPIYRAGVEAAPALRRNHRQEVNFDAGIPAHASVKTHWVP